MRRPPTPLLTAGLATALALAACSAEVEVEQLAGTAAPVPAADPVERAADAAVRTLLDAEQLAAVWRDPDFDAAVPAAYYLRVLEIPTPRWTTYDAAFFGVAAPAEAPAWLQERAYTSPIWYSPRWVRIPAGALN